MLGIPIYWWPPLFGLLIWLLLCFQAALGLRWIKLGRRHLRVHRWIGITLVVLGPVHGLMATSVFLGWPFHL